MRFLIYSFYALLLTNLDFQVVSIRFNCYLEPLWGEPFIILRPLLNALKGEKTAEC